MNKRATLALLSCLLATGAVQAKNPGNSNGGQGPNFGPGASSAADATLNAKASDQFVLLQHQQINPITSTAGFATQFADKSGTAARAWTLADTVESGGGALSFTDKLANDGLSFSFTEAASQTGGTWSVTNTSTKLDKTLDLALSFHAGDNVGSFLFNDRAIKAGQTLTGTWAIQWLENAAQPSSVPGFSNVAFYTGNVSQTNAVPEPETYAMLLGGLGLMGWIARRRKA